MKISEENIEIQKKIGYFFKEIKLLQEALIHTSYANECDIPYNYERFEFLGDSVLELVVREKFFNAFPEKDEGFLSGMKGYYVSGEYLSRIAKKMDLGKYLMLGCGEKNKKDNKRKSLHADLIEAIIGAVYIDGGIKAAKPVIEIFFNEVFENIRDAQSDYNYKNKLQMLTAKKIGEYPEYEIYEKFDRGKKSFIAKIFLGDQYLAQGFGDSKKEATKIAAKKAYNTFKKKHGDLQE